MTRQDALDVAHEAPRCQHYRLSGRQCGSPALAGRRLCYFHHQALRPKLPNYKLPLLEDAASVQFGLVQVVRALEDKAYDSKTGALLLYALQTASSNLKRLQQEQAQEREQERREQQQAEEKPGESLADILIRGLGLREPDAPRQDPARFEAAGPEQDSGPAQPFASPLHDPSDNALDAELSEEPNQEINQQKRCANVNHQPTFDETFPQDPPTPPARRSPASAPPRNEAGHRGRGSA